MAKEKPIERDGVIVECFRNRFSVRIDDGIVVSCTIAGKLRKHFIRIVPGDEVTVEMSPYDLTKGRITYRKK